LSYASADLKKFFTEIAEVSFARPGVPMFMHAKAAASDAVSQGRFAQVGIGIRDIRKVRPFRSQKIEADGIDRTPINDIRMLFGQAALKCAIFQLR
jgi:hypothetical protein